MLQYRETHNRHTSALTTKTLKYRHTFTAETHSNKIQSRAHKPRLTDSKLGHTHETRGHGATAGGRLRSLPALRPTQRLQTLRSSRPTDSHKQFDNHSPRSHSTSTRPAPGHWGGQVA